MTPPDESASSNVARAVDQLKGVLDAIGWEPEPADGITGFVVDFGPPHVPIANALAAISPDEQFVFYINFGYASPPDRRDEIGRLIARANWGLTIGNFEMDDEDGQVRFKSSVNFSGVELTAELIRNAILPAMTAVEAYADAVADVLLHGKTAQAAIASLDADHS